MHTQAIRVSSFATAPTVTITGYEARTETKIFKEKVTKLVRMGCRRRESQGFGQRVYASLQACKLQACSELETTVSRRRRQLLVGTGATLFLPLPQTTLAAPGAKSAAAFQKICEDAVLEHVKSPWGLVLKTVFHDVATYDKASGTGGLNGSLLHELDREENSGLTECVEQLLRAKAAIDENEVVLNPISFSDLLAIAGLVKIKQSCVNSLCSRTKEGTCEIVFQAYGNKPQAPKFGRVDTSSADSAGLVPLSEVSEFKDAFARMGLSVTDLCVLAPVITGDIESSNALLSVDAKYADILKGFEKGKKEVTRTSYEIPLYRSYTKLCKLGAQFDKNVVYFA
ncbi:hypothetical protein CYMTET_41958 [Cymbomonas tetramitiformis]|uniref:Plant heme peroxidase family profile domain-containing protein n=1 Tax=Cymbomonas tetramitiformis TaxID=36881 RepID=A0AAE0C658_9CHLO|nr:hypothetical protein CYMTET_41958 [Cymbomonas tetramitiformis]